MKSVQPEKQKRIPTPNQAGETQLKAAAKSTGDLVSPKAPQWS